MLSVTHFYMYNYICTIWLASERQCYFVRLAYLYLVHPIVLSIPYKAATDKATQSCNIENQAMNNYHQN